MEGRHPQPKKHSDAHPEATVPRAAQLTTRRTREDHHDRNPPLSTEHMILFDLSLRSTLEYNT